jgi:hypothetical protein
MGKPMPKTSTRLRSFFPILASVSSSGCLSPKRALLASSPSQSRMMCLTVSGEFLQSVHSCSSSKIPGVCRCFLKNVIFAPALASLHVLSLPPKPPWPGPIRDERCFECGGDLIRFKCFERCLTVRKDLFAIMAAC